MMVKTQRESHQKKNHDDTDISPLFRAFRHNVLLRGTAGSPGHSLGRSVLAFKSKGSISEGFDHKSVGFYGDYLMEINGLA